MFFKQFNRVSIAVIGIVAALGVWVGISSTPYFCSQQYKYVNRDYVCGEKHVIAKTSYLPFSKNIQDYIDVSKSQGVITNAAVYFRDLRAGPVFGVDEKRNFAPASLLKLPLVIALFSFEEESPGLMHTKLIYSSKNIEGITTLPQFEKSPTGFVEGEKYTVEQLARAAIVESDNLAFYVLVRHVNSNYPNGTQEMLRVWQELGVIDPRNPSEEVVTARGYTSLFRLLYNVSYLNAANSEKVLTWLKESTYEKGLMAGVPSGIDVANKFGERTLGHGNKELHDCGIVYFPNNPYALCVMVTGTDFEWMSGVIAEISKRVYEEVDPRRL